MINLTRFSAILLLLVASSSFAGIDPDLLAGIKGRGIGPAGMSGRVTAIDVVLNDTSIIYVGTASGGLWKSTNNGLTWKPLMDDKPVASFGSLAIYQKNPDIVWAGTGEANPRNSMSPGRGIYKSMDAGRTWEYMGLEKTERISRLIVHPDNPDIAWAAALGQAWGENKERGVYKTTDGGKTWEQILYINERTGAADMVVDPSNPEKIFVAMWEYRRWPWFFKSGGPGSGLYRTVDGGQNWDKLSPEDGMPKGELGRIGLAISPSHPEIVYALVEARDNQMMRSNDGGYTFKTVNKEKNISPRPFYYADIRVDPQLPNRVYRLDARVAVSVDYGKTFKTLVPYFDQLHPDHHAMWINPEDGRHIINGNDGGMGISHDSGKTWRFVSNLPLAQYYHIRVDNDMPYNVYGGMQDNGSWRGPAAVWENGGIRNHHWEEVGFGDGFDTIADPEDSMTGYAMSQQGYLSRWNLHTGERQSIRPAAENLDKPLRFNWNAGIAIDPFDSHTLYFGSQYVHKSTDKGNSWTIISADMTSNNPEWQKQTESGGLTIDATGAENYTTITAIAASPVKQGVLWVGSDDGYVHISKDGGENWQRIDGKAKVPANLWVPQIHPSPHDAGTAFVIFGDHRRNDWTPYIFKVTDFGKRWKNIASKGLDGYVHSLVQDTVNPNLLFAGTEFGLFVSFNDGKEWLKWTHGVPTVAVRDLALQERESDLVLGTFGRSAIVIDDIRPLRKLNENILKSRFHLFEAPAGIRYQVKQTGASRFPGHGEFRGENRKYGIPITWVMNSDDLPHPDKEKEKIRQETLRANKKKNDEDASHDKKTDSKLKLEIRNENGEIVRKTSIKGHQGLNRYWWNLGSDPLKKIDPKAKTKDSETGRKVLPGKYSMTLAFGDEKQEIQLEVLPDPRMDIQMEQLMAREKLLQESDRLNNAMADAVHRVHQLYADIDRYSALAKDRLPEEEKDNKKHPLNEFSKTAADARKNLEKAEFLIWAPEKRVKGILRNQASRELGTARWFLTSGQNAPTKAQKQYLELAREKLSRALKGINKVVSEEIKPLKEKTMELELEMLNNLEPLEL